MAPSTRLAPCGQVRHVIAWHSISSNSTAIHVVNRVLIRRRARAGLCGFLAHGPLSHFWYLFCDNAIAELPVRASLRLLPCFRSEWVFITSGPIMPAAH